MERAISQGGKMKFPRIVVVGLALVFTMSLFAVFAQATPEKQRETTPQETKQPEKIRIPKEIKAMMQEGLATRKGRQDIPFTIFKTYEFPVQGGLHTVFFFRAKNSDLGFAAPAPAPAAKTQGQQQAQQAQPAPPATEALEANLNIYYQFLQTDASGATKIFREGHIPFLFQEDSASYDPNKEDWYSFGYPLPPGKYTLAMALATPDMKRVGLGYYDFTLPGPDSYQTTIDTTPVFFTKKVEQMQSPEMMLTVHRGYFTYSVLQIVPNIDDVVTAEDKGQIEVFFYIFGAKTKEEAGQQPKNSIEVTYEVQHPDGKNAIKWETQKYDFALVSQPLPLKQTLMIKDEKGERTEQKDLAPGKYDLVINIKDMVSGDTVEKKVPFEVK
jgi:hypothetical protein